MKVAHVHRLRGVGGSERHLLTLLPALRSRGIDATFIGLDDEDPDPFYDQLDLLGVPYVRLRAPRDIDPEPGRSVQPDVFVVPPDEIERFRGGDPVERLMLPPEASVASEYT